MGYIYNGIYVNSDLFILAFSFLLKTFNEKLDWQKSNAVKSSLVLCLKECVK